MIYFVSFLCILFFFSTLVFGYYSYKFGKMILDIQDEIEKSIDILDERTESISRVLEIPLFYDSPEIKKVHEDLKKSKETILDIAKSFSQIKEIEEEQDAGQEEN